MSTDLFDAKLQRHIGHLRHITAPGPEANADRANAVVEILDVMFDFGDVSGVDFGHKALTMSPETWPEINDRQRTRLIELLDFVLQNHGDWDLTKNSKFIRLLLPCMRIVLGGTRRHRNANGEDVYAPEPEAPAPPPPQPPAPPAPEPEPEPEPQLPIPEDHEWTTSATPADAYHPFTPAVQPESPRYEPESPPPQPAAEKRDRAEDETQPADKRTKRPKIERPPPPPPDIDALPALEASAARDAFLEELQKRCDQWEPILGTPDAALYSAKIAKMSRASTLKRYVQNITASLIGTELTGGKPLLRFPEDVTIQETRRYWKSGDLYAKLDFLKKNNHATQAFSSALPQLFEAEKKQGKDIKDLFPAQ